MFLPAPSRGGGPPKAGRRGLWRGLVRVMAPSVRLWRTPPPDDRGRVEEGRSPLSAKGGLRGHLPRSAEGGSSNPGGGEPPPPLRLWRIGTSPAGRGRHMEWVGRVWWFCAWFGSFVGEPMGNDGLPYVRGPGLILRTGVVSEWVLALV